MRALLLIALFGAAARAQLNPAIQNTNSPAGRIEGIVMADENGLPLRRTSVVLRPVGSGPAVGTQTDDRGNFVLRDIAPGTYSLTAERTGYLTTNVFRRNTLRMPPRFSINRGDLMTGVVFRLKPWSVVGGRVRFEDGEPAVGVRMELYVKYHVRGRQGFQQVAVVSTNDRGEYRVPGLPPGSYFIAAVFEGTATGPGVQAQPRIDPFGRETSIPSYSTTFYPNTLKLSEAVPVRVRPGDDVTGIDLYLRPVTRVKLAGRITDGTSGQVITAAAITLGRLDSSNNGTMPAPTKLTFDRENRFHLDDVAPGDYELWVDASAGTERLVGRTILPVTDANIENLELVVNPARLWSAQIIAANGATPLPRDFDARIVLEPRSERGAVVSPKRNNDVYDVSLAPGETYDVYVDNLPGNYYIAEVRVSGVDMRASGLTAAMASTLPFQIVLDSRGGEIIGGILGPADPATNGMLTPALSGAAVTLIPEPPMGRLQYYMQTYANEYGQFDLRGIAPGRYTIVPWLDEPPCDVYEAEELDACRTAGSTVSVTQALSQTVILNAKVPAGR